MILAAPKIGPHTAAIRQRVADLCGTSEDCIGIKAKTPEGTGTDNAAIAHVTVLLKREASSDHSLEKEAEEDLDDVLTLIGTRTV